ncbi:vomeronasal type-2 receptor 26-like [Dendropsophus ebraccatus]|uniref:vomeronasal type-2 receptor 26-like n=1 Tax=Dendropsophus ebraccatus TaxID=150705 RepID=UPI00383223FE
MSEPPLEPGRSDDRLSAKDLKPNPGTDYNQRTGHKLPTLQTTHCTSLQQVSHLRHQLLLGGKRLRPAHWRRRPLDTISLSDGSPLDEVKKKIWENKYIDIWSLVTVDQHTVDKERKPLSEKAYEGVVLNYTSKFRLIHHLSYPKGVQEAVSSGGDRARSRVPPPLSDPRFMSLVQASVTPATWACHGKAWSVWASMVGPRPVESNDHDRLAVTISYMLSLRQQGCSIVVAQRRLFSHLGRTLWHLLVIFPATSYSEDNLAYKDLSGILVNGDILVGAIIPLHLDIMDRNITFKEKPPEDICIIFRLEHYQYFQAMRFAIDEINRSPELLPNISLGFYHIDSCAVLTKEMKGTLWMLTGLDPGIPNYCCRESPPLAAIIGHSTSSFSIQMAFMLGLYRYPQVSFFSTSPLLSDKTKFPSFFRTVPSDHFQCLGLAEMVKHFGWTWVGLVGRDNDSGREGVMVMERDVTRSGACVAFKQYIPSDFTYIKQIVKVIKRSTAKVVVIFCTDIVTIPVLEEMLAQDVSGKLLVATEAWSISNVLSVDKYSSLLSGTIGFAYHSYNIKGFQEYLNSITPYNVPGVKWAKKFWEEAFGCSFSIENNPSGPNNESRLCTGYEDLSSIHNLYNDASTLRTSYNVYSAVHVIAKALDHLMRYNQWNGPFSNRKYSDLKMFKPWQLMHYLKNVQVPSLSKRELFFNKDGDPPAMYDIVNWQRRPDGSMTQVKVGSYDSAADSNDTFTINSSLVWWPHGSHEVPISVCSESCPAGFRKASREGKPLCCFECVRCPQGEISNQTDSIDCSKCPWDMVPNNQKDRCLAKPIEYLSYYEPLGFILVTTSVSSSMVPISILRLFLLYKNTPMVRANNYSLSCILLVSLSFCFLSSLAFIGYPEKEKCLLRQAAFGMVFALCVSCILAKTIMVVFAFMATKPGSSLKRWTSARVSYMIIVFCSLLQFVLCVSWILASPPFTHMNIDSKPGILVIECNENSPIAFWIMLGYLGLLASISFIVAFYARRLPDSFNEAKFITFSMLAFLSVWLSYIPASLSSQGKYTVAMEIFAIQASSWALVICMFLPKCFIILFRPHMNTKEHLLGETLSQNPPSLAHPPAHGLEVITWLRIRIWC